MYQKTAPESIQAMFASIASDYDKANTTFSFGLHKRWNKKLIDALPEVDQLLDLCAGTGEIAFGYLAKHPAAQATLLDFCPEMLAVAQKKGTPFEGRFSIEVGDAQHLPCPDKSVDAVTISYGIRNVRDPGKCFQEVARVLRPGGHFAILELTRPTNPLLRLGHKLHLRLLLPLLGRLAAKNGEAYTYLSKSVEGFASPEELEDNLRDAGLTPVKRIPLMGGLTTLFLAKIENLCYGCSSNSGGNMSAVAQLKTVVAAMIQENERAQEKFDALILSDIRGVDVPGFWAPRTTFWVCMDCHGCSGGRNDDADACKAVALLVVIAALVIVLAASIKITYTHHEETKAARAQLNAIRTQKDSVDSHDVEALYDQIIPMQRANLSDFKAKTLSSATVSGGISLMTAAACIALFAVVTSNPVSFHATTFAVAGGGVVVLGLGGHAIRLGVIEVRKRKEADQLFNIYNKCVAMER